MVLSVTWEMQCVLIVRTLDSVFNLVLSLSMALWCVLVQDVLITFSTKEYKTKDIDELSGNLGR